MNRLETHRPLDNQEQLPPQVDTTKKIEELQTRLAKWKGILDYATKNVEDRIAMIETMTSLTPEQRAEKIAAERADFAAAKAEYEVEIRAVEAALAGQATDLPARQTRENLALDQQLEHKNLHTDAVLLERALAMTLRGYPALISRLSEAYGVLLPLEEMADRIQRRGGVDATKLMDTYRDALQNVLRKLGALPENADRSTAEALLKTLTEGTAEGVAMLEKAFPGPVGTQKAEKLTAAQAHSRMEAALKGSGSAPANPDEVAHMGLSFAQVTMEAVQEAGSRAIGEKLTAFEQVSINPMVASNPEFQSIMQSLAKKLSDGGFNPGGVVGFINRMNIPRNTELETAMIRQIGGEKFTGNPDELAAFISLAGWAVTIMMTVASIAASPAVLTWRTLALGLVSVWSTLLGDLRFGNVAVLKTLSSNDMDLMVQYTNKAKALETAAEKDKARISGEMRNLAMLLQHRSLRTQRSALDLRTGMPWDGLPQEKQAIDEQRAALQASDTEGVLGLYDQYMALSQSLAGKNLQDPAQKAQVDSLLALEKQLKDKGVHLLGFMDEVRRAAGVHVRLPDASNYVASLQGTLSAPELAKLLTAGSYEEYMRTLSKGKEQTAGQAVLYVTKALDALKAAGIPITVDTKGLTAGSAAEKIDAAKRIFDEVQAQLQSHVAAAPTYDGLLSTIETKLEQRGDALAQAYAQVKAQKGSLSLEEARNLLSPHITAMHNQITGGAAVRNILTLTIWSDEPEKQLASGALASFVNATDIDALLRTTLEMYGAANEGYGTGDKAKELATLHAQKFALKDVRDLAAAFEDVQSFYKQLGNETEVYSTLADSIAHSRLDATNKGRLRQALDAYQNNLVAVHRSLDQFSQEQMASLLGDVTRRGVSESFGDYVRAARAFVANNKLTTLRTAMQATLEEAAKASPADQLRILDTFESSHLAPMKAAYAEIEQKLSRYKAEQAKAEVALKDPLSREVYNEQTSFASLQKSAAEGYSEAEKARGDIATYIKTRDAYRAKLLAINTRMASFYGVGSAAEVARLMASEDPKDRTIIDRLMIIDETAFDQGAGTLMQLIPTEAQEVSDYTARFATMLSRAEAYERLLDRMGALAGQEGNRDRVMLSRLRGLKFVTPKSLDRVGANAYSELGIFTAADVLDDAVRFLDPGKKLKNPKAELAGLMNTLVFLSGQRGRQRTVNTQRGHETSADTMLHALTTYLPRFRKNLPAYNKGAEGYKEADFIAKFVEEKDMFEVAQNLRPVEKLPGTVRFVNMGIDGKGSPLLVRNGDTRIFMADIIKNVEGVELKYTVYLKRGCMNVQVAPTSILSVVRQLRTKLNLPKPGMSREMPMPEMPGVDRTIALREAQDLKMLIEKNTVTIPAALLALLASFAPDTPVWQQTPGGVPTKPGSPSTEIPTEKVPPKQKPVESGSSIPPEKVPPSVTPTPVKPTPTPVTPEPKPTPPAKASQSGTDILGRF